MCQKKIFQQACASEKLVNFYFHNTYFISMVFISNFYKNYWQAKLK